MRQHWRAWRALAAGVAVGLTSIGRAFPDDPPPPNPSGIVTTRCYFPESKPMDGDPTDNLLPADLQDLYEAGCRELGGAPKPESLDARRHRQAEQFARMVKADLGRLAAHLDAASVRGPELDATGFTVTMVPPGAEPIKAQYWRVSVLHNWEPLGFSLADGRLRKFALMTGRARLTDKWDKPAVVWEPMPQTYWEYVDSHGMAVARASQLRCERIKQLAEMRRELAAKEKVAP